MRRIQGSRLFGLKNWVSEMGGIWGRAGPFTQVRLALTGRPGVMMCVMWAQGGLTDKELLTLSPERWGGAWCGSPGAEMPEGLKKGPCG